MQRSSWKLRGNCKASDRASDFEKSCSSETGCELGLKVISEHLNTAGSNAQAVVGLVKQTDEVIK